MFHDIVLWLFIALGYLFVGTAFVRRLNKDTSSDGTGLGVWFNSPILVFIGVVLWPAWALLGIICYLLIVIGDAIMSFDSRKFRKFFYID